MSYGAIWDAEESLYRLHGVDTADDQDTGGFVCEPPERTRENEGG